MQGRRCIQQRKSSSPTSSFFFVFDGRARRPFVLFLICPDSLSLSHLSRKRGPRKKVFRGRQKTNFFFLPSEVPAKVLLFLEACFPSVRTKKAERLKRFILLPFNLCAAPLCPSFFFPAFPRRVSGESYFVFSRKERRELNFHLVQIWEASLFLPRGSFIPLFFFKKPESYAGKRLRAGVI